MELLQVGGEGVGARLSLEGVSLASARSEVLEAIQSQRERGLLESVKWLAELLVSLKPSEGMQSNHTSRSSGSDEWIDVPLYHLGKAYFDSREYLRCFHALRESRDPRCHFLASYSLYLAGEMRKQEELAASGPKAKKEHADHAPGWGTNPFLWDLSTRLQPRTALCPYSSYLRGVVLRHLGQHEQSAACLAAAIKADPLLWCAWFELARHLSHEKNRDLQPNTPGLEMRITAWGINSHWMFHFFRAYLMSELQFFEEGLADAESLLQVCPGNIFARTQQALNLYNMRDFEASENVFEEMWRQDPFRISELDVYSNVLYVRGAKPKLSYLAHRVSKTDRFRPESCCIMGNYYSMRGDHTKAVSYFTRALRLNPSFLSAWTLMGHEFMELSNAVAAVHCYRRAVDINERDFRAWYALGQAYEILGVDTYAMWYFHKACSLRPHDSRMWVALGGCFEKIDRPVDAVHAFERAVAAGDSEGTALRSLARLHERQRNPERAAFFYRSNLEQMDAKGIESVATTEALWFLARYHESKGQWKEAERYAMRLLDFAVPEKDEAKAMLKRLHVRQQQAADVADANAPRPASATGVGFLPSLAPGKRHH